MRFRYDGISAIYIKFSLFLTSISIVIFRNTIFFIHPRFFAEEGVVYFSYAFSHSLFETIFNPRLGYYSLLNNLSAAVSASIPLHLAPVATTMAAFIVQCIPLVIVVWGNSPFWNTSYKKIIILAAIIFAPFSAELWLNTINSQFYFSLITMLILCEDHADGGSLRKYLYRLLLMFSGLTGAVSCFLTPLFLVKAYLSRNREAWIQTLLLCVCSLIQILVILFSDSFIMDREHIVLSGIALNSRGSFPDIPTFGTILFMKHFAVPFFGRPIAEDLGSYLFIARRAGEFKFLVFGYLFVLVDIISFSGLFVLLEKNKKYLLGGFLLLTVISTLMAAEVDKGSLFGAWAAHRYYYVPNVLLFMMLFMAMKWKNVSWLRKGASFVCMLLLTLGVFNGVLTFRSTTIADPSWPDWRQEVKKWEKDRSYMLKIWPQPGWQVRLYQEDWGK